MRITLKGKISVALVIGLITIITISYFVINIVLNKNLEEYIKNDMKGIITYSKESCSSLVQLENTNNSWITLNKISSLFNVYINWNGENVGQVVYEGDINKYKDLDNDTKSLLKLSNNDENFYATLYYPLYVNSEYEGNLIIQKDYSDIFSSNKSVLNVVLASEMIMISVLFIVIYLITNKSTKPLRKLTRAMESLGMGEEVDNLPIDTKDDISVITEGFNNMKNNIVEMQNNTKEFFNNATHELKTPLTILKGHLTGMLNKVKGYENREVYMERSLAVVEKMETLVKELLYLSKTDESQKSEYKMIDLAELLRVQIADVTELLSEKELSLTVDIPDKLLCEVDSAQMERALDKCHSLFTKWRGNQYIIIK